MADKFDYALLSDHVYVHEPENEIKLDGSGWTELDWVPDHPVTGFSVGAYQKGNEVVIAFTGSNEKLVMDFLEGNIPAALGVH